MQHYIDRGEYDKEGKHINRIRSSVKNLVDIINNFLSIEKIESGKVVVEIEKFDLSEFLQNSIDEMDGMLKPGQNIKFSYYGDVEVLLDKKLMRNIVLNLLSNAIKYSEKEIYLVARVTGREIFIEVTDQGIGISEEEQEKLFRQFFRAENARSIQGTGLGLNIVKHYVELLGGTVQVTSLVNHGTTFLIHLESGPLRYKS
jgi:signal transduction histidine kinase